MLTAALFSHSRNLCGAERMLLNLALLLERTGDVRPVLLVPGEGELSSEARRELGLAFQLMPQPPWYLLPAQTHPRLLSRRPPRRAAQARTADVHRYQQPTLWS